MQFQMMARERIQPSPLNPRKHFDPEKLQELAATMANGVGIIEPLVVRPRPDLNCYELVAGERRWRAAAIASLDQLPVVVKELTDAQVLRDHGHREQPARGRLAAREAEGFRQLLQLGKFDVEALAERLGRSRKYVYDRMKLLSLEPAGMRLLERGIITAGHAILLARLTPEQQAKALDLDSYYGGLLVDEADDPDANVDEDVDEGDEFAHVHARSVREFQSWIERHIRFDPKDPTNLELFPDTVEAFREAAKVVSITHDHHFQTAIGEGDQKILTGPQWKRADGQKGSTPCDKSVLGVVVVGPGRGNSFRVCTNKHCDAHWKQERLAREAAKKGKSKGSKKVFAKDGSYVDASKVDEVNCRWEEQKRKEQAERDAWKTAGPSIIKAAAARIPKLKPVVLAELVVSAERLDRESVNDAARMLAKKQDAETVLQSLALAAVIDAVSDEFYAPRQFPAVAKKIGVDVVSLLKAVQTSATAPEEKPAAAKTKAQSKAVSDRMRKYWAERTKAKGKAAKKGEAA